jgi:hypothetical protein
MTADRPKSSFITIAAIELGAPRTGRQLVVFERATAWKNSTGK